MKLRERKIIVEASGHVDKSAGVETYGEGENADTDVDEIEDAATDGMASADDISADSSDEGGGMGVATSGGKAKRSHKAKLVRAASSKKTDANTRGQSILKYLKPKINNAGDGPSEAEESDSDDGVFVVSHRKSVLISRKRKVLAQPGEKKKLREGLRDARVIRYREMSSADELDEEKEEEGQAACMQQEQPTASRSAGQVCYSRRKKDAAMPDGVGNNMPPDEHCKDDSKAEPVKQYKRLRKRVDSPASPGLDDSSAAVASHDRKVRQRKKDADPQACPIEARQSSPVRKQPSRSCARKHNLDESADEEAYYASDDEEPYHRPSKHNKGEPKDISMLYRAEEALDLESFPYKVDQYGLCSIDGGYAPPKKRFLGSVEKILSARTTSEHGRVFCVKEHQKSYRSVSYITERQLQQQSAQLLRNFLKRLDSLGRTQGHAGDDEESPAFDPHFIEVDRIISFRSKFSKKSYYVKWRNLPYTDSTWEDETALRFDRHAIDRFWLINKPGTHFESWKLKSPFKDGRTLRSYQEEGVSWLDHEYENKMNCILADEMGLGKTIQSVAMIENLRSKRKNKGPFLVVAPVSTMGHWQREVQSLTTMNCVVYGGNQDDRETIRKFEFFYDNTTRPKFHVLLTSFEILMKDQTWLSKQNWEYVIIDEAHRLKAKDSKTTSAVRLVVKHVAPGGLLLLTGTPVQNNMKEIFGLLNLLDPVTFGSEEVFLSKYGDLKDAVQVNELQEQVLRPRLLRRLKEDVEKSIPQKEETIIWVELTKDQRVYYKAIYENAVPQLLKGSQSGNISSLRNVAMELRKVCNHPFLCNGLENDLVLRHKKKADNMQKLLRESSGKMILVDKLLPSLKDAGRRVLIFSQFTIMLDLLEDYLLSKQYSYERIDGKIRGTDRQAAIDRYSAKGSDIFVFLLSTRAGGLGITLTAADTCIIYDSDWNPQNDLQAMARCHRIGQTKDVRIYRLITRRTYEQQLFECSSKKYGLDEAILGNRLGADAVNDEHMKNIENLLKNGAYDILKDDGEADAFSAQNIDQILEQRTQKRLIGGSGCNTFSVATFAANEEAEDADPEPTPVEQSTEEFWKDLFPEAYEVHKATKASKRLKASNAVQQDACIGRRRRARIDYTEIRQVSDDEAADGQKKADLKKPAGGSEAQTPGAKSSESEEEHDEPWSELELKRLEERMMSFGRSQIEQIRDDARLQDRSIEEVEEVMEALVTFCQNVQAESESTKEKTGNKQDGQCNSSPSPSVDLESEAQKFIKPMPSLPSCVESAMKASATIERLKKNATRLLHRLQERKVLAEFLKSGAEVPCMANRQNKLPFWWGEGKEDLDLLRGAFHHGHHKFKKIKDDTTLVFHQRVEEFGAETWPSDAVLTSRLRKVIQALSTGITDTGGKRKAAEMEAKAEATNQKLSPNVEAPIEKKAVRIGAQNDEDAKVVSCEDSDEEVFAGERAIQHEKGLPLTAGKPQAKKDNRKKGLKLELPLEPENREAMDEEEEKIAVKKAKAEESRHKRQMQLKNVQWHNQIKAANAKNQAMLSTSLAEVTQASKATITRSPEGDFLRTQGAGLQFDEYEAATRKAILSSGYGDKQRQHGKVFPDLTQVKQSAPLMGMKQLVRHISPSSYVKEHEDMAIAALPLEKPVSKVESLHRSQTSSSSMMIDSSNKENELPQLKRMSRNPDINSRVSKGNHKQQTLLPFLTKKPPL